MAFAGLWDKWRNAEGEEVLSCTMVVSGASPWMEKFHDRMPVVLSGPEIDGWLDGSSGADLLKPAAEESLREWLVSNRVNKTGAGDEEAATIEPLAKAG